MFFVHFLNFCTQDMEESVTWKKVILFGDSITERSFDPEGGYWGASLANKLQRLCDVVCRGFSGYNSESALIMLPSLVRPETVPSIQTITIFFGANDACLEDTPTKQNVPLDDYKKNLLEMITYLVDIGLEKERIVLINIPPYCFEEHKKMCMETTGTVPRRSEKSVHEYATACVEVAKSAGVPHLDLYSAMVNIKDWQDFLSDGLHLNSKGGSFLADQLWTLLEPRICCLPRIFPDHKDLFIHSSHWQKDLQKYCTHVK